MSALPPKADIERHDWHVRLVPASPECKSGSGSIEGPALCERSDDVIEGPGRGVLMRDVIHLLGDGVRMREIIVALILPIRGRSDAPRSPCARKPRGVDDGVDGDVADMDALRPQILRKALREDALGGLRRREGRAHRDAAE